MEAYFPRRELTDLLRRLDSPHRVGVFVLGGPAAGKTVLLHQLAAELQRQGRAVVAVKLFFDPSDDDLGARILGELPPGVAGDLDAEGRMIRGSARSSFGQNAAMLNLAAERLQAPVLLLDALDESPYPQRMAAAVEELSRALRGWWIVVASRPVSGVEVRRFAGFDVLQLGPLTETDMLDMLAELAPDLPLDATRLVITVANGNPLVLRLAARVAQLPAAASAVSANGLQGLIGLLIGNAVGSSQNPAMLDRILVEVALAGGRDRMSALAGKLHIPERHVRDVLNYMPVLGLLTVDHQAGTVAFIHTSIQEFVVTRIFDRPFQLAELRFGAEEAERDDLLDASFVERHSADRILQQQKSIIIGDRGSGKSAIFRKLVEDQAVETLAVANTGDLLHRIVAKDAWLDADALRAAWLVIISGVVAAAVSDNAPKAQRRNATDLRVALGLPTKPPSRTRRAMRAAGRLLGGTTLKLGVGPVSLEAELPAGTRPGGSILDIEEMLHQTDQLLKNANRRVMVLLDRIDETFKYDRPRQEAVVQALLQAEARVSQMDGIDLVLFLRTDLFELYDIQEKNKLVSRSLTLEWSEEDWLRMLIRRAFANQPFAFLAAHMHVADEDAEVRGALEVLFPAQIEGQAVDRWLTDSLRNGNGDISPRLAVLLLHLTQEHSVRSDAPVTAVPLFAADAMQRAMTKVSELSFSEVVNDFKVAPTFVLNCRAGKLTSFTLENVGHLFDAAEGKTGDQVRLLERLGFLERVVEQRGAETTSLFRIPRLYTRCWDYA
ncbi:P-loop ATPase, Sll1717 family [Sphaerisporangium sp. NPDC004334]